GCARDRARAGLRHARLPDGADHGDDAVDPDDPGRAVAGAARLGDAARGPMSLKDRLKRDIASDGPITVADYMSRCLLDPAGGYAAARAALGDGGVFLPARLVSQVYGELIGLWAVGAGTRLGAPGRFRRVEGGPGDGTLMDDPWRAARVA